VHLAEDAVFSWRVNTMTYRKSSRATEIVRRGDWFDLEEIGAST
jgi:hypothetical protein